MKSNTNAKKIKNKKRQTYSWVEKTKLTFIDTFTVSRIMLADNFAAKLIISLISFLPALVLGSILIYEPKLDNVSAYYTAITGSLSLKLFLSIFETNNFEKNRTLYLQFTPLAVTLGKMMKEWIIYIMASIIFVIIVATFIIPFHKEGSFLLSYWTGAIFYGFIVYLTAYVIMRFIFALFKSRAIVVASQIIFVVLILVLGNFIIKMLTGVAFVDPSNNDEKRNGGEILLEIWDNRSLNEWVQKYDKIIMWIPILNSRLYENIGSLNEINETWTIGVATGVNILIIVGLLWFVVTPLEKRRMTKLW